MARASLLNELPLWLDRDERCGAHLICPSRSLATLRKRGLTLPWPDFVAEANAWLDRHLTSEGRRTMLSALRQGRAASRREESVRTVRLPATTHAELLELAEQFGLTVPETIARLVSNARPGSTTKAEQAT